MPATDRVVIVGGGLAGAVAAQELRAQGFDGDVTILGAEPHPPYERPPLSKTYLRGESVRQGAYVLPEESSAALAVVLKTGVPVTRIDRDGASLELADGGRLRYDRLILAPGSRARSLAVPGAELDGVRTLRTFEDADEIRRRARRAEHVLVVGGGWIGSEVTASLRQTGVPVTWALTGRLPLERTLGRPVAEVYGDLHAEHGVIFLRETRIAAFDGDGRVRRARTSAGRWLPTDLVVVAVGATPRVELAEAAGLTVSDGVIADGLLQSDDRRILVAGDIARVPYPDLGRSLRVEHWGAARDQGKHAARTVLGHRVPYGELPYFYSDQYDTGMEFWGDPLLPGEIVVRGELRSRSFTAFWYGAGRVRAALNMHVHQHSHSGHGGHQPADHGARAHEGRGHAVNPERHEYGAGAHPGHGHDHHQDPSTSSLVHTGGHLDQVAVRRLLRSSVPVDLEALRDPGVPLGDL